MTIEGNTVLEIAPDFSVAPQIRHSQRPLVAGGGNARSVHAFPQKHVQHFITHEWSLHGLAQIAAFSDFFYDRAGAWGAFWLPSWHPELNPILGVANGAATLTIEDIDYATVYDVAGADLTRLGNYVWLYDRDGSVHYSKVTAATPSGGNEELTLETAVTRDWNLGEFMAGLLYLVAFQTDDLQLRFKGPAQADTGRITMAEVVNVSSDADVT